MATPPSPSLTTGTPESDVVFDVRPIPCRVKHGLIFQRWLDLPVGRHFVLLNDHDPVPLRYQFEAEFPGAFSWDYIERGPEEFRVKITKLQPIARTGPLPTGCGSHDAESVHGEPAANASSEGVLDVDARGLEPPEPLIRILDALERLPAGTTLRAHTDREPCHLFGEATNRGFRHDCKAQPDGSWITLLARA